MEPAERKQKILSAIVESFIKSGEPVGSKALIREAGLKVSSATVRNDMAELTDRGYLAQPHTSAGRVPTEQGYRYYIDNVMRVTPVGERGRLGQLFHQFGGKPGLMVEIPAQSPQQEPPQS